MLKTQPAGWNGTECAFEISPVVWSFSGSQFASQFISTTTASPTRLITGQSHERSRSTDVRGRSGDPSGASSPGAGSRPSRSGRIRTVVGSGERCSSGAPASIASPTSPCVGSSGFGWSGGRFRLSIGEDLDGNVVGLRAGHEPVLIVTYLTRKKPIDGAPQCRFIRP